MGEVADRSEPVDTSSRARFWSASRSAVRCHDHRRLSNDRATRAWFQQRRLQKRVFDGSPDIAGGEECFAFRPSRVPRPASREDSPQALPSVDLNPGKGLNMLLSWWGSFPLDRYYVSASWHFSRIFSQLHPVFRERSSPGRSRRVMRASLLHAANQGPRRCTAPSGDRAPTTIGPSLQTLAPAVYGLETVFPKPPISP